MRWDGVIVNFTSKMHAEKMEKHGLVVLWVNL